PLAASTARSPPRSSLREIAAESVPWLSSRISSTRRSADRRFSVDPRVWLTSRRSESVRGSEPEDGGIGGSADYDRNVAPAQSRDTFVGARSIRDRRGRGQSGTDATAAERAWVMYLNHPRAITS